MLPLDAPYTEPSTGIAQPPGGLMFALRCESGAPGAWAPVQAFWQVGRVPGGSERARGGGTRRPRLEGTPPARAPAQGGSAAAHRRPCQRPSPFPPLPPHPAPQVAPLLLPGGNPQSAASLPGGYGAAAPAAGAGLVGGSLVGQVAGQVAALLPGEAGAKLQTFTKKAGHQLGNFLQRF